MADRPLTNNVYLTKEQLEWLKIAIHHRITYQDHDEPQDWQYDAMHQVDYAHKQFRFCKECWTHWVARYSDDTHTCPPKEEE